MFHHKLWGLVLQCLAFEPLQILPLGLFAQFLQNHFGLWPLGQHIQALMLNRDARLGCEARPHIS